MTDVSLGLIEHFLSQTHSQTDSGIDLKSIEALREAFSMAVPFENLTVLNHDPVSLSPNDVFEKLISGRGGYCFELNTAFNSLLKHRGLQPNLHLGRVWLGAPKHIPPRSHVANVVTLEGRPHIIDVGFGGRAPKAILPLFDFGKVIDEGEQWGQPLRIIECHKYGYRVQRQISNVWTDQFSLEREAAHASDIEISNFFQSRSLNSRFRKHLLVGRFIDGGRTALFDNRLTTEKFGQVDTTMLATLGEVSGALSRVFGIDASGKEAALERMLTRVNSE